jgi:SAM-dependent methyltransferase
MDIVELKAHLDSISAITNQEWLASLDDRKRKELEFHNRDRDRTQIAELDGDTFEKFYANKKFYSTVSRSSDYVEQWLAQHARGKVFLDYACGNGVNARKAAKAGAALAIGFDISDVSVQNARADAAAEGLGNTYFFQADAENTKLPDGSIDVIVCSGMLHHLDLSFAFPEIRRILAPGGRVLAIEALDYNPFIKLYRHLTPSMRTDWERAHILSLEDVEFARRFFDLGDVRYWHVTSYAGAYAPKLLPFLNLVDDVMVRIPGLRLLAWMFTFELLSNKPS